MNESGIVLVTGCFDIIHAGHIALLEHAKYVLEGASVWVGMNSDASIRILKGTSRPINRYPERARVMSAIRFVDHVFQIDDVRVAKAIQEVAPQIWLKGGDYTLETLDKDEVAAAHAVGANIFLFKTIPGFSTSKVVRDLAAG